MGKYILRRLLQAIPLVILISMTVFLLMHLIPGGPLAAYESPGITPEDLERLKHELGLDVPLHIQYWNWLSAIVRGNWGTSIVSGRPVLTEITERIFNTLYLSIVAFIGSLLISIPLGVTSATRQYSKIDNIATTIAFFGQSIPIFWMGLILIIIFNVMIKNPNTGGPLLPGGGMSTIGSDFSFEDRLKHLILPATVLIFFNLGTHVRYTRSGMLDVLHQDYIRTAHAKGLPRRAVILKHALRNSLLPLITIIGLELPGLFNGALITETIFSWPGMGRLFFNSIDRADYSVMMGVLLMNAILIVLSGLLTDIVYGFLNPRIRFD
jgi:peptide/nickel transport system permease protein